ncbi:serine hydrolase domain-containing protein [Acanthopleuribacter pedis]|uniref:Beta-lactamase family protein n=1 Tax=Acanthopleuribacter pedis TaxID=442870 RepID=A0A8J7U7S7_9BACT|nr:serine hydrolase domain-containing protein [Acanthopleuribacter pedis]MBO1321726.1 beta-lactamase family protein [Acanthopleuribacter pedis]
MSCPWALASETRAAFPHFTQRDQLWNTKLVLSNLSLSVAQFQLTFYSEEGESVLVTTRELGGSATKILDIGADFPQLSIDRGWVAVESTTVHFNGMMTFTYLPTGATTSLPLDKSEDRNLHLPLVRHGHQIESGFALVNRSDRYAMVQFSLVDIQTNTREIRVQVLPPHGKRVSMIETLFDKAPPASARMEVKCSQGVTGFGLSFLQDVQQIVAIPALAFEPVDPKAELQRDLETLLQQQPGGISITLQHGEQLPVRFAAGLADMDTQEAYTPDHVGSIGSTTKTMVATAFLQLVEQNKALLDQPLSSVFPDYPKADQVTMRMLLNHTSGIPAYDGDTLIQDLLANPARVWNPEELLAYSLNLPYAFEPGQDFAYTNTNYLLLGMILERLTGDSLAQVLRNQIFTPLAMNQTYLRGFESPTTPHAQGYLFDPDNALGATPFINAHQMFHGSCTFGDAGVVTTTGDMVRFMTALVGGDLLSENMMDEMVTPSPHSARYGLGIAYGLSSLPDEISLGHNGSFLWGNADLNYYPDEDLTLALQYNLFGIGAAGQAQISETQESALALARIASANLKE